MKTGMKTENVDHIAFNACYLNWKKRHPQKIK